MAAISDQQISNWAQSYEKELCAKYDLIVDRISLPVTPGVGIYNLPGYVTNIRTVLYLGRQLYAKGSTKSLLTQDTPFTTTTSYPFEYTFGGFGLRVLRFLPTPQQTVALYTDDLWTMTADKNACIVEFYRLSDTASGFNIPDWYRRYVLKNYICWKGLSAEGPGQDLRAADYYQKKMDMDEVFIQTIKSNMRIGYLRVASATPNISRRLPGKPVLPPNFGLPTYGEY